MVRQHKERSVSNPDTLSRMDLEKQRQFYAEELRAVANIQSEELVHAFAKVPREHFLGPGPWQIVAPSEPGCFPIGPRKILTSGIFITTFLLRLMRSAT